MMYIYYIYILYELMDANGALLTITIYFCSVEAGPGVQSLIVISYVYDLWTLLLVYKCYLVLIVLC